MTITNLKSPVKINLRIYIIRIWDTHTFNSFNQPKQENTCSTHYKTDKIYTYKK